METESFDQERWKDPVVAEVREIRRAIFEEAGNDIEELARRLRSERTSEGGMPISTPDV